MQAKNNFLLGAIFFGALLITGIFTIVVKDVTLLQGRTGTMSIVFDRVDGLEVGHKVLASGMEVGTVSGLRLQEDGNVLVNVTLTEPLKLYENHYKIKVKDTSALGGKHIDIVTGAKLASTEELLKPIDLAKVDSLPADYKIQGSATPSILDNPDVAELISSLKSIANKLDKGEGTFGLLIKEREIYDNLRDSSENLRLITEQLRNAESTLGKLLYDRELYDRVERIAQNVEDITGKINRGEGPIGRALNDDELYDEFKAALTDARQIAANVREVTDRVKNGEGTVGKLFTDDRVYTELEQALTEARTMMRSLNQAMDKINKGEGTIGTLMSDDKMAKDLQETIDNVKVITARLREGEGTLGQLMANDELYKEMRRILKNLSDSLEDTREQVPITTFTNILFKAF